MATFTSAPREWSWSRRCHRSRAGTPKRKAKFLPDLSRHSPATPPQSCRGTPPHHESRSRRTRRQLRLHGAGLHCILNPCRQSYHRASRDAGGSSRRSSTSSRGVLGTRSRQRACPAPEGRVNPRCHEHAAPGWEVAHAYSVHGFRGGVRRCPARRHPVRQRSTRADCLHSTTARMRSETSFRAPGAHNTTSVSSWTAASGKRWPTSHRSDRAGGATYSRRADQGLGPGAYTLVVGGDTNVRLPIEIH